MFCRPAKALADDGVICNDPGTIEPPAPNWPETTSTSPTLKGCPGVRLTLGAVNVDEDVDDGPVAVPVVAAVGDPEFAPVGLVETEAEA